MELTIAKRWAVSSLVAEIVLMFLSVIFSSWLFLGVAAAGLIAFGIGMYISIAHKNHFWLFASIVAIGIPLWAIWSIIAGLNNG